METLPNEIVERILSLTGSGERSACWHYADVCKRFYALVAWARPGSPLHGEVLLGGPYAPLHCARPSGGYVQYWTRLRRDLADLHALCASGAFYIGGDALLARIRLCIDFSFLGSLRMELTRWTPAEKYVLARLGGGLEMHFSWERALQGPLSHPWANPLGWRPRASAAVHDTQPARALRCALRAAHALFGSNGIVRMRRLAVIMPHIDDLDGARAFVDGVGTHVSAFEEYVVWCHNGGDGGNAALRVPRGARSVDCIGGGCEALVHTLVADAAARGERLVVRGFAHEFFDVARSDDVGALRALVLRYGGADVLCEREFSAVDPDYLQFHDTRNRMSFMWALLGERRCGARAIDYLVRECGARLDTGAANGEGRAFNANNTFFRVVHLVDRLPDAASLRTLLEHGGLCVDRTWPNFFATGRSKTLLDYFIMRGLGGARLEKLTLLIEHTGARVLNAHYDPHTSAPLHLIATSNDPALSDDAAASLIRLLVQRGASPSVRGYDGTTPLAAAIRDSQFARMRVLLECGASVLERASTAHILLPGPTGSVSVRVHVPVSLSSVLFEACASPTLLEPDLRLVFAALPAGRLGDVTRADRQTLLHAAVRSASVEKVLYVLVKWRRDPRARDRGGRTPLDLWNELWDANALVTMMLTTAARVLDEHDAAAQAAAAAATVATPPDASDGAAAAVEALGV